MELTEKIKTNPLAYAIYTVMKVMRVDHAGAYVKAYNSDEIESDAMNRAYKQLKGVTPISVIDAYDNLATKKPKYLTDLFEVIHESRALDRRRKADIKQLGNTIALPRPEKTSDKAVKMLATAKTKVDKANALDGKEEWLKRKELADLELKRLTSSLPRRYADNFHQCCFPNCHKAGTITNSTNGGESWYCSDHIILG